VSLHQLVEQRAVGVSISGGGRSGNLEQLQSVPDPHVADQSALGGHDHRDPGQRILGALRPHHVEVAQPGQR
jgi:hypothetical protein